MTVAELRAKLLNVPDDALVILSRDTEGNGFSTLEEVVTGQVFDEEGDSLHFPELTPELVSLGYGEDDVGEGDPCVVLWP